MYFVIQLTRMSSFFNEITFYKNRINSVAVEHTQTEHTRFHPSGSIDASPEDKSITQRIVDIFHPLNIKVLDHIIVGGGKYSSMADDGNLMDDSVDRANYEPFNFTEENKLAEENDELEM